jgi:hypothetical protein
VTKTVEEVLDDMASNAKAAPMLAHTLVSGRVRIDVEWLADLQRASWRVNGRVASYAMASRALNHARLHPLVPFVK